ncbi:hypothetical protein GSI_00236 [Ganoderma sinense ZZ0214-1]|uniref:Uncharacterized protein n=1 Tax=Ganoderma sinense ZZ0214-1 TaxID=1077348 RepID=A0A2G8SS01_9APHY|nr:hypothetical protein GSI_00236 [Ganoderma sinense ZZ0214-1]
MATTNEFVLHEVHTFYYENSLYTVVNPSVLESLPGMPLLEPETLDASDIRKALALLKCPELAYAPRDHHFTCDLLKRLNCHMNDLPLIKAQQWTRTGWKLNPDTEAAWYTLESVLHYVINILDRHVHCTAEKTSGFDIHWPPPSSFGYHTVQKTEVLARAAAHK